MNTTKTPEVSNRTEWTLEQAESFKYIGKMVNNWRNRDVHLYEHPTDPEMLVTIGRGHQGDFVSVVVESRSSYETALDYIAHGKVYTYN